MLESPHKKMGKDVQRRYVIYLIMQKILTKYLLESLNKMHHRMTFASPPTVNFLVRTFNFSLSIKAVSVGFVYLNP
jgi:hypothetical protein